MKVCGNSAVFVFVACLPYAQLNAQEKSGPPMKEWEADVRKRMEKDENLKKLAAKYPLVLLHSRAFYFDGDQSTYSFKHRSWDVKKHGNDVQLLFHNGGKKKTFQSDGRQWNLFVHLGKVAFEKDPEPKNISVEDPRFLECLGQVDALEGHVYLERIRDEIGSNFYVLFQVVAVDPEGRYMAFVWRMLPGGKIAFPVPLPIQGRHDFGGKPGNYVSCQNDPVPAIKDWEKEVGKRLSKKASLSTLASKYPLVVVHSHNLYDPAKYDQSGFSFVYETSHYTKHWDGNQLSYTGNERNEFSIHPQSGQRNFIVDMGEQEFEKNPDPAKISIDHPGLSVHSGRAADGHVYLQRVRTDRGSDFYVLFQVAAVDSENRYMAFLWRRLPGGKLVKRAERK